MYIGETLAVQYSTIRNGFLQDIPDVVGVEWIVNRQVIKTVDPLDAMNFVPYPGPASARGTIYTRDPNICETLIDKNQPGIEATGQILVEYLSGGQTIGKINVPSEYDVGNPPRFKRKIFQNVIWCTAGGFSATQLEEPANMPPRVHRIAFVLAIPENGRIGEFILNYDVFVNQDGSYS